MGPVTPIKTTFETRILEHLLVLMPLYRALLRSFRVLLINHIFNCMSVGRGGDTPLHTPLWRLDPQAYGARPDSAPGVSICPHLPNP